MDGIRNPLFRIPAIRFSLLLTVSEDLDTPIFIILSRMKDGTWQKAMNMGPIINTRGFEVSPFFHHKFNVLYFSSNGQPLTFGDFDIYKVLQKQSNLE